MLKLQSLERELRERDEALQSAKLQSRQQVQMAKRMFENKIHSLEKEKDGLLEDTLQLRDTCSAYRTKLETTGADPEDVDRSMATYRDQVLMNFRDKEEHLRSKISKLSNECDQLRRTIESDTKGSGESEANFNLQLSEKNNLLAAKDRELQEKDDEIDRLRSTLATAATGVSNGVSAKKGAGGSNAVVAEMQKQISTLKQQLTKAKEEASKVGGAASTQQNGRATGGADPAELVKVKGELDTLRRQLKEKDNAFQEQIRTAQEAAERESGKGAEVGKLKARVAELEKKSLRSRNSQESHERGTPAGRQDTAGVCLTAAHCILARGASQRVEASGRAPAARDGGHRLQDR
eukprot:Rmarinus@m.29147